MLTGELADLEAQRKESRRERKCSCSIFSRKARNLSGVLREHPSIVIVTVVVFAILCGAGLGIIYYVKSIREGNVKMQASQRAHDTISWFCKFRSRKGLHSL